MKQAYFNSKLEKIDSQRNKHKMISILIFQMQDVNNFFCKECFQGEISISEYCTLL